jgi:hypothetical protein
VARLKATPTTPACPVTKNVSRAWEAQSTASPALRPISCSSPNASPTAVPVCTIRLIKPA